MNLHKEWGLTSFSIAKDDNKRLVYISYNRGSSRGNILSRQRNKIVLPFMYNKKQIKVINESRLVYDI